jgi:NAD(P)-dependent dehydrogenase (short-subunit alcohol dehydrogenase family)
MTKDFPDSLVERINAGIPLGRMGRPREIVGAVLFLLADAGSYVTGASFVVDGGALIV